VLNEVNTANCGSLLPRMTHSLFDFGAEREHLNRNFSILLAGRGKLGLGRSTGFSGPDPGADFCTGVVIQRVVVRSGAS